MNNAATTKRVLTGQRKKSQGSKWCWRPTRFAIYHRDGFACVYCRSTKCILTIDHVTPCELGGTNDPTNLVTACLSCNSAKRALSLRAFLAFLRSKNISTTGVAARVRRLVKKPLDRVEGRRLALAA
jgi:5-methylcytosine-specific restriction endonuclease McrA